MGLTGEERSLLPPVAGEGWNAPPATARGAPRSVAIAAAEGVEVGGYYSGDREGLLVQLSEGTGWLTVVASQYTSTRRRGTGKGRRQLPAVSSELLKLLA